MAEDIGGDPKERPKDLGQKRRLVNNPLVRSLLGAALFGIGLPATAQASDIIEPTPQVITNEQNENVSSEFTNFITEQALNPEVALQFSEQELRILEAEWNRTTGLIQEMYGSDIVNRRIIFEKSSPQQKPGHGVYTFARGIRNADGSVHTRLGVTEINPTSLWEINHQLGHIYFTNNFTVAVANDHQEKEFLSRMGEGIAEALAYSLYQESEENRLWGLRGRLDSWLNTPVGQRQRQNPDHSRRPFDWSREDYDMAAASILDLQNQFGPGLIADITRLYRERQEQMLNPNRSVRRDIDLSQFGYSAMLDQIEKRYPSFKEALRNQPSLYFGELPQ